MSKKCLIFIFSILMIITLCSCKRNDQYKKADFELKMNSNNFKIINFADVQMDSVTDFDDNKTVYEVVKHAINTENPDMITFSGDNAWGENTLDVYKVLLKRMDEFKVPYFLIYGNHDREHAKDTQLAELINSSEYGHIASEDNDYNLYGNYTIDIKNKRDKTIHRIIMMDSYCLDRLENIEEIKEWRNNWYKENIDGIPFNSTIIMHIPFLEFFIAYEEYQSALKGNDDEKIKICGPIGPCRMGEQVCTSDLVYGFFQIIKNLGNTKNVICGHDHNNDFSLMLDGVRLTYSVKTGPECYMYDETMCGYTVMNVSKDGQTNIEQKYYYVEE